MQHEKIAEATYIINKQAKRLRDERQKQKWRLFSGEYEWEDRVGLVRPFIEQLLDYWEEGCQEWECLDCESEPIDCNNEEHEKTYCRNKFELCSYCKDEVNHLKDHINEEHEKLTELRDQIEEIYTLKDNAIAYALEHGAKVLGYHEFSDDTRRRLIEWHGWQFHNGELDDEYCEQLEDLGIINYTIDSNADKSDMTVDKSREILNNIGKV